MLHLDLDHIPYNFGILASICVSVCAFVFVCEFNLGSIDYMVTDIDYICPKCYTI